MSHVKIYNELPIIPKAGARTTKLGLDSAVFKYEWKLLPNVTSNSQKPIRSKLYKTVSSTTVC